MGVFNQKTDTHTYTQVNLLAERKMKIPHISKTKNIHRLASGKQGRLTCVQVGVRCSLHGHAGVRDFGSIRLGGAHDGYEE